MKRLIASLISLLIAFVLIFFFIIPLWDSLSSLKSNLTSGKANLEQLEVRVKKVNHLKKEYQNLGSEIQKVFLALPDEEDIPNLLVQFEALATSNGLILDNISFGQLEETATKTKQPTGVRTDLITKTPKESGLRSLGVSMSLAGRYPSFKNYLNSLADNIRSMSAETVSFGSSDSTDSIFTFDLTVNVYYQ